LNKGSRSKEEDAERRTFAPGFVSWKEDCRAGIKRGQEFGSGKGVSKQTGCGFGGKLGGEAPFPADGLERFDACRRSFEKRKGRRTKRQTAPR